jgi:hypothetical protein
LKELGLEGNPLLPSICQLGLSAVRGFLEDYQKQDGTQCHLLLQKLIIHFSVQPDQDSSLSNIA